MKDDQQVPQEEEGAAGGSAPPRAYEPPVVARLGSLRDLLAAKSGPGLDPSPQHTFSKQ